MEQPVMCKLEHPVLSCFFPSSRGGENRGFVGVIAMGYRKGGNHWIWKFTDC